jgi:hypothetical protein
VKKGKWSAEEDATLQRAIQLYMDENGMTSPDTLLRSHPHHTCSGKRSEAEKERGRERERVRERERGRENAEKREREIEFKWNGLKWFAVGSQTRK